MIIVLGDLIADIGLRIPQFPIRAGDLHPVEFFEVGPGGASNVAIAAARLGLPVACLAEIGDDLFGQAVLAALQGEGIEISQVMQGAASRTPVAGVVVDRSAEPAYLGYAGHLTLDALPPHWAPLIEASQGVFADGWAENEGNVAWLLEALRLAHRVGVPIFFDPGPGNPRLDNGWHRTAISLATVLLATEEEAAAISGLSDPIDSGRALLALGPQLVVIKRGVAGCFLLNEQTVHLSPGFPVEAVDATGAGDSLAAAVIFACLRRLSLEEMGILANASGAAKVQKMGTGLHVPTRAEIRAVLERFHIDPDQLLELDKE